MIVAGDVLHIGKLVWGAADGALFGRSDPIGICGLGGGGPGGSYSLESGGSERFWEDLHGAPEECNGKHVRRPSVCVRRRAEDEEDEDDDDDVMVVVIVTGAVSELLGPSGGPSSNLWALRGASKIP